MASKKKKSGKKSAKKITKKSAKKSARKSAAKPAKKKSAKRPARAQPESLRGRRLSASLTVNDLQKSLAWYRDVIGFTVERNYEREGKLVGIRLKAGNVALAISQDDGAQGVRVKGAGFSLQITTAQSVDALAAQIKARGGVLLMEPTAMRDTRVFRIQDPDGFKLAFTEER